jgi:hypothetical protein
MRNPTLANLVSALLQGRYEVADAETEPLQVDQRIDHEHPRSVVGDLAAAVDLYDRYVAGCQQVLATGIQTQREYRAVLCEPDLVGRFGSARIGEALHGPPKRLIVLQPEFTDGDRRGQLVCRIAHKAIMTSSCAVASR